MVLILLITAICMAVWLERSGRTGMNIRGNKGCLLGLSALFGALSQIGLFAIALVLFYKVALVVVPFCACNILRFRPNKYDNNLSLRNASKDMLQVIKSNNKFHRFNADYYFIDSICCWLVLSVHDYFGHSKDHVIFV